MFELHGPDCVVGEDLLSLELHLEEAVGDSGLGAHVLRPVHVALAPATLLWVQSKIWISNTVPIKVTQYE